MGAWISGLFKVLSGTKERKLIFLGLDAAGKTTILYKLKLGEVVTTIPTIGFNVETISYKNINITAWDVGSRDKIRPLWRHYYHGLDALIWVVDANDRDRVDDSKEYDGSAKQELWRVLEHEEIAHIPVLVFGNKADLPNAMTAPELVARLGLNAIRSRPWHLQMASAITGDGLYEGLEWLRSALLNEPKAKYRGLRDAAPATVPYSTTGGAAAAVNPTAPNAPHPPAASDAAQPKSGALTRSAAATPASAAAGAGAGGAAAAAVAADGAHPEGVARPFLPTKAVGFERQRAFDEAKRARLLAALTGDADGNGKSVVSPRALAPAAPPAVVVEGADAPVAPAMAPAVPSGAVAGDAGEDAAAVVEGAPPAAAAVSAARAPAAPAAPAEGDAEGAVTAAPGGL